MLWEIGKLLTFFKVNQVIEYIGMHSCSILLYHFLSFKIVNMIIVIIQKKPSYMMASFPTIYGYEYLYILYGLVGIGIPLLIHRELVKAKIYVGKLLNRDIIK